MSGRDIVVIGASAGGVEALCTLAASLPSLLPAAILVVLHIPPHTPSNLQTILARAGPLPVEAASDYALLQPGKIYVAVPDRHLLVESNRMRITRGPKENRARPAIDALFRSAAYHFGERVIGILLSGNLDDGTAGLWAVKDRGGIALVQAPEEAPFPSMPQSAIQHVAIDHVLSIADMAPVLDLLIREPIPVREQAPAAQSPEVEIRIALGENGLKSGTMQLGPIAPTTCPECHGVLIRIQDGSIQRYRCHTGHTYSSQTLLSQIDGEIEYGLVNAVRALDERILLLQQLEQQARTSNEETLANRYAQQALASEQWGNRLRDMLNDHGIFG